MASLGTIKTETPLLDTARIADYGTTIQGVPLGSARREELAPEARIKDGSYRLAGTESSGDEPIDRVQWFPRGDWDNDGE